MQAQKAEGTRDLIGAEMRAWQKMQQIAAGVFEPFGFKPIETPAIEQVDVFVHGIGQSTDVVRKEMFRVFSGANLERVFTEGTDTKLKPKQRLALRPEGTAGVVRAVVENNLVPQGSTPFKAYYAEAMFRGERPQKGRLREFVQCDIDILGDSSPNAEVELIDVTARALLKIGFTGFTININDRRILRAMLEKMGFAADQLDSVCISFDKMDKIGADGVKAELTEKGFAAEAVQALDDFLRAGDFSLDAVAARVDDEALTADLRYVIAASERVAGGRYAIAYAPSLVRGQGYYTGMVFEVTCPQFSGAVAGGGRYDNMVGKFIGQQVPAVGFSIGFERVCGILLEQGYQIPGAKPKMALLYLKDADFAAVLAKAEQLRADYDVTVLPQAKKLGKQFGTLEAAGFNAVAFADNEDVKLLGQKAE